MKKTLKWFVPFVLVLLLMTACSNPQQENTQSNTADTTAKSKYVFMYKDIALPMNAEFAPILEKLGEPNTYFEAASCAFNGLDKIYTYAGIEINTYPNEDNSNIDYISSVRILDNTVKTPEGLTLGDDLEAMFAAYGQKGYEQVEENYAYTDGDVQINILFEDSVIVSIEYIALHEAL